MIRVFSTWCTVGDNEGEIKGETISEVINNLCNVKGTEFRHALFEPETDRISNRYIVVVNGKPIDPEKELNRRVKNGDRIAIFPALGGG